MSQKRLDRNDVIRKPLSARTNRVHIERDHIDPNTKPGTISADASARVDECAERIQSARKQKAPVMMTFGAHTIKNGLAPVLIQLIEQGWLTHLATNGAGVIHDWEFAWQGESSEDVAGYLDKGQFGHWEETGYYINLALNVGAWEGLGYGESVGALIHQEGLTIPSADHLAQVAKDLLDKDPAQAAATADLLHIVQQFELSPGFLKVPHNWKKFSVQAAAFAHRIPFTSHPMFGHDIIYNHPMNYGALLGRVAERDYLCFAESVSRLEDGVYLSLGSAVMSPMVFEKSMSMAQNLALQRGAHIDNHFIGVVDLADTSWDWGQGEPPEDHPAYYLRYNKTFSRMGGTMRYLSMDNRDFLLHLVRRLKA